MTAPVASTRPLAGRVIAVTRAAEQAGALTALLEAAGARVLLVPTIEIGPPDSWAPLDAALADAAEYRWVIFTSANGVEMVRRRLAGAGHGAEVLAKTRTAAIGPATAAALREWGLSVDVVPGEYVAEALAERLRPLIRPGDRVLLPRAAETRDLLVRELAAMGARVDEVPAYRTRPAAPAAARLREAILTRSLDVVTFTSSSTVRNCAALFDPGELARLLAGVHVACIGPVTRATAAEFGLEVDIVPGAYTIPALAGAIAAYFETQRS